METNDSVQTPPPQTPTPSKKSATAIGPIAVIVIIVGILAVGAWYFLNQNLQKLSDAPADTVEGLQASDDPDVQASLSQSSSDELDSIQADVSATDFSGVESSAAAVNGDASAQ